MQQIAVSNWERSHGNSLGHRKATNIPVRRTPHLFLQIAVQFSWSFDNVKSKQPANIEWWNIRLQGYDFSVIHTQYDQIPLIFSLDMPIRMKLRHMRKWQRIATTSSSPVLYTKPCLMRRLNKQPKMKKHTSCGDDQHKPVGNISWLCTWRSQSNRVVVICKDILTVSQDAEVILLGNHIVTPDSLYQRAISIAHESHQGPVKTKKKLLHEKKWFP